jgi:hypothetical protein
VLIIFNADDELRRKALPHVSIERQEIDWDGIFENDFGGGHSAAILWARCIWGDTVPEGTDPMYRAFSMDGWLRRSVLKALAIRWGLEE